MDEIDYLSCKYGVSPVFVEKLSFYNDGIDGDELEQLVIDQINYLKNWSGY